MASEDQYSQIGASQDVAATRYFAISALAITLYDWLIIFSDEIELVGKARCSIGKILYYFTRIITTMGLCLAIYELSELNEPLSSQFCVIFTFICPTVQVISLLASYWLLMLRLVALYQSKQWVVWLLYFTLFSSYICAFVLLLCAQIYFDIEGVMGYSDSVHTCAPTARPPTIAAVFYAPLAFEVLLFVLTLLHAWNDYRAERGSVVPLLRVMYRDGALLFVVMAAVRIWNMFIFSSQPLTRMFLGIYLMWALITILSNRIYLNVVGMAKSHISDRLPSRADPNATFDAQWRGSAAGTISRPRPPRSMVQSPTRLKSGSFNSTYFENHYSVDRLTVGTIPRASGAY